MASPTTIPYQALKGSHHLLRLLLESSLLHLTTTQGMQKSIGCADLGIAQIPSVQPIDFYIPCYYPFTFNRLNRSRMSLKLYNITTVSYKWANPGLFFVYFWSFQANNTMFTTNQCEKLSKCPSSIQCQDSNPQPYKYESSPITTRPGLPPLQFLASSIVICGQVLYCISRKIQKLSKRTLVIVRDSGLQATSYLLLVLHV